MPRTKGPRIQQPNRKLPILNELYNERVDMQDDFTMYYVFT